MNKLEMVESIATKNNMTKKDAEKALNALTESISDALKNGERVMLTGFGTFEARKREERKGRNPQTGEEITIKASTVPVFRAGNSLKEMLNK